MVEIGVVVFLWVWGNYSFVKKMFFLVNNFKNIRAIVFGGVWVKLLKVKD